ncbi:hypothetical protein HPB47_008572 [Ixodes persulcatus]|uniref:Uncharacterized protein n=1 Tax=Ixodes persulcatus TaxID=34615 RepID=A0AC60P4P5_IXOPE|nr:hypothetical protein HPB47_008572 [Ixodes persulcatus]
MHRPSGKSMTLLVFLSVGLHGAVALTVAETEPPVSRPPGDFILIDPDLPVYPTTPVTVRRPTIRSTPGPTQRPVQRTCSKDGSFRDPIHCGRFFTCLDGRKTEMNCPEMLRFNEVEGVCDWPRNVPCTTWQPKPPGVEINSRGRVVCTADEGYFPSPRDCREFYRCHRGSAYRFDCPRGLIYNRRFKVCDWPWNVDARQSGDWKTCRWGKGRPRHNKGRNNY